MIPGSDLPDKFMSRKPRASGDDPTHLVTDVAAGG